MHLASGGADASFGAESHTLQYDLLWHAKPAGFKVRPFIAAGGGVKVYHGTGAETTFQPLENFALLTRARDLTAVVSAGGGVKVQISPRMQLRLELRDYLTPFPTKVIAPNAGSKVGGWIQDFVPMVGLVFTSRQSE